MLRRRRRGRPTTWRYISTAGALARRRAVDPRCPAARRPRGAGERRREGASWRLPIPTIATATAFPAAPHGRGRRASVLGRYGWKPPIPDLEQQIADAFARTSACRARIAPVAARRLHRARARLPRRADRRERAARRARNLRRDDRARRAIMWRAAPAGAIGDIRPGRALFAALGCAACHVPACPAGRLRWSPNRPAPPRHGSGLDDGVGEPGVVSAEWRTARCWLWRRRHGPPLPP